MVTSSVNFKLLQTVGKVFCSEGALDLSAVAIDMAFEQCQRL
jgi:hypothetical protein